MRVVMIETLTNRILQIGAALAPVADAWPRAPNDY